MRNNIPTVTFSPTCMIKFKNEFLYLKKMTIHHTSMHTVNTSYYDLEILLYHNRNPTSDIDGGVILSILLNKGNDYGNANNFMNQFVNQLPAVETPIEQDVPVSDDWNPSWLFPNSKSFFYYDGALPYPPCSQNWTIIIFEEVVPISGSIIQSIQYALGSGNKNIRPIQSTPKDCVIFYNSDTQLDSSADMSNSAIDKALELNSESSNLRSLQGQSWLKKNIYIIKGILITVILLLMIYCAICFARYFILNDVLNSFIIKQVQKKKTLEIQSKQAEMRAQQEAEYGGPLPNSSTGNMSMGNMSMSANNQQMQQQQLQAQGQAQGQ
jgi:carbonic anhydrase